MRRNRDRGDLEFAQSLRRNATKGEQRFWANLRGRAHGYKFRRQHAVSGYVLDFYCPALKLAIEVDGPHHDLDRDGVRDERLSSQGLKVVRVRSLALFQTDREIAAFIEGHIRIREDELDIQSAPLPPPGSLRSPTSPKIPARTSELLGEVVDGGSQVESRP